MNIWQHSILLSSLDNWEATVLMTISNRKQSCQLWDFLYHKIAHSLYGTRYKEVSISKCTYACSFSAYFAFLLLLFLVFYTWNKNKNATKNPHRTNGFVTLWVFFTKIGIEQNGLHAYFMFSACMNSIDIIALCQLQNS